MTELAVLMFVMHYSTDVQGNMMLLLPYKITCLRALHTTDDNLCPTVHLLCQPHINLFPVA